MARDKKANVVYLDTAGNETKLTDGPATIRFKFVDGRTRDLSVDAVSADIQTIALVRGLAEKIRDTYAGAEDVDEAYDECGEMIATILAGEWLSARESGGPGISHFVQAVIAVKTAAGAPIDEAAIRERYVGKDKAKLRNETLAGNAALRAAYGELLVKAAEQKAARARERLAKATAEGGTAGDAATL